MRTPITKVAFLYHEANEDLYAAFELREGYNGKTWYQKCYSHIGQHSRVSNLYINESIPATPEQYKDLLAEIISIYGNVKTVKFI